MHAVEAANLGHAVTNALDLHFDIGQMTDNRNQRDFTALLVKRSDIKLRRRAGQRVGYRTQERRVSGDTPGCSHRIFIYRQSVNCPSDGNNVLLKLLHQCCATRAVHQFIG